MTTTRRTVACTVETNIDDAASTAAISSHFVFMGELSLGVGNAGTAVDMPAFSRRSNSLRAGAFHIQNAYFPVPHPPESSKPDLGNAFYRSQRRKWSRSLDQTA